MQAKALALSGIGPPSASSGEAPSGPGRKALFLFQVRANEPLILIERVFFAETVRRVKCELWECRALVVSFPKAGSVTTTSWEERSPPDRIFLTLEPPDGGGCRGGRSSG